MTAKSKPGALDPVIVRRWLIIFVCLGVVWRLTRFALAFPIWGDEAMLGLNVLERSSYAQLLEPLKYFQVAPAGYLWSLRFVFNHFGVSDYSARLPALIASLLALFLYLRWARLLVSPSGAMFATGLIALSGYIVRHGVELKPYAFDLLAAVLLLLLATEYLTTRRMIWLVGLTLAAPFCAFISYPQIFVAGAIGLALMLDSLRGKWAARILSGMYCMVVAGSFLAIMMKTGRGQYLAAASGMVPYWHAGFPPANPFHFVLWFLQIHTGNLFAYPVGGKNGASVITTILFGFGAWTMWRKWSGSIRIMLFAPFLLTFIAAILRLYPYGDSARVSQHLAPIIILAVGVGFAVIIEAAATPAARLRRAHLIATVIVVISLVRLSGNILWPYKTVADDQMRSTVRRLIAAADSDPIVVLHRPDEATPTLLWYLRERQRAYLHDLNPAPESLRDVNSAWTVTCTSGDAHRGPDLAARAQMKWTLWSRQDLLIGPKELGPSRLEVDHLTR